ncbi:MAG: hypothetical protein AAGB46_18040 [Verrucomicrobiota bacterium]
MKNRFLYQCSLVLTISILLGQVPRVFAQFSEKRLDNLLKRFPEADANGDGELSVAEALAYREQARRELDSNSGNNRQRGGPREVPIDAGWDEEKFPEHAVCYMSPEEIRELYASLKKPGQPTVVSFEKPKDGALRIVGTGHSFMAPGYRTLPLICEAAGFEQPLYTHTSGGMTGSARYKWEQENGIFQFDGKPMPKLLASISNAEWDAMMWGPYFMDRPEFYTCWIDFCKKYNPEMKFFLSDAWPQLYQLGKDPESEDVFTEELMERLGAEKNEAYGELLEKLREENPGKVFMLPTSDAMVLAAKHFLRGELPGIEGMHKAVGGKDRSLWRDRLGHLGPGFDRLEGYVFYATLYGRSPELIEKKIRFEDKGSFPSPELDRIFRKITWQAVINHPLSGVTDEDGDGIGDLK